MDPIIEPGATVLFQGDSITDAGRGATDPEGLGGGYAMMAASWFSAAYPEHNVRFFNRGISGNRATDLERRWERDCLALRPDWVSIMIGINDTWRAFDSSDPTSTEAYESSYRTILAQTVEKLGSHLILIEPFVLPVPEDRKAWRADLDPRIQVVRALADEFDAILVPLDGIMNAAGEKRDPAFWAPDGVHPTPAGHALIAQSWLRAVKAIA
jgi:lysophospholipase L1-like esterase